MTLRQVIKYASILIVGFVLGALLIEPVKAVDRNIGNLIGTSLKRGDVWALQVEAINSVGTAINYGLGIIDTGTQRVTIATDDAVSTMATALLGAISSNKVQVDVVTLPASPATCTTTGVADQATTTTIVASDATAKYRAFYNDSTAFLYLDYDGGGAATTDFTVLIAPGGYWSDQSGYTGVVSGIWSSDASGSVYVTQCN